MALIENPLRLATPPSRLPDHGRLLGVTVTPQPLTEAAVMVRLPSASIVPLSVEPVHSAGMPASMIILPLRVAVNSPGVQAMAGVAVTRSEERRVGEE